MRKKFSLLLSSFLVTLCALAPLSLAHSGQSVFAISPYLQLGESGRSADRLVCWAVSGKADCKLEFKSDSATEYRQAETSQVPLYTRPELRFFQAKLSDLKPGENIQYRILLGGQPVFESSAKAVPAPDKGLRVALFGDIAYGGTMPAHLISQVSAFEPDLVMLTGDLVEPLGTASSYLGKFFPAFSGLISKVPFAACPGDKDISSDKYDPDKKDNRNLDAIPGAMAYFCFWKQPLNGPGKLAAKNTPVLSGAPEKISEFEKCAPAFPRSANYSFDLADSHWLVLDGGAYVDWRDESWKNWVRDDLKTQKKTWNFVVVHQPAFSSDPYHGEEQRMRLLSDVFEQNGVDIVFSGHSNSYQCSCPLHFSVQEQSGDSDPESNQGYVYGKFKLDKNYDGVEKRVPDGVIYVISGGGGAELAEMKIQDDKTRWQPYTRKFYSDKCSATLLQITGKELTLRQVSEAGQEIDRIRISK